MTDLYRVLLCFRDGKNLQFCFKSEATSEVFYQAMKPAAPPMIMPDMSSVGGLSGRGVVPLPAEAKDDYGNIATVVLSDISAVVRTNVNADLHAQTDLQIVQAHNEIYKEKKMESDPTIREAIKRMQARAQLGVMNGQRAM